MKRMQFPLMEALESRTLLSVAAQTVFLEHQLSAAPHEVASPNILVSTGPTLNLTANVSFTGAVAFYPSPVLDPPLALSASIDWGDGTSGAGTLQYATQNGVGGYQVIGTHTYSNSGTYKITSTLSMGPLITPGKPSPLFVTRLVAEIVAKAIVAQPVSNSAGGVTINEIAGQKFTIAVGSFNAIAPATGLRATITWGDGSSSTGQLVPAGIVGLDVIHFSVAGTHTYAKAGTFPIHILITRMLAMLTATPIQIVATINSTAVVTSNVISLAGTLTGTYTNPIAVPDVGKNFKFVGAGAAGDLGNVSVSGNVLLPGFIATGQATGTLTLTNANGTVTLKLTAPAQAGFSNFPATLSYAILQGTGAYAGVVGSGTIAVTLTPSASAAAPGSFTFVLT